VVKGKVVDSLWLICELKRYN